jgi:hypothetical protein
LGLCNLAKILSNHSGTHYTTLDLNKGRSHDCFDDPISRSRMLSDRLEC